MNEIRKKQYELEMLADLVDRVNNNIAWNQHTDENGIMVDDEDETSQIRLAAYRSVIKSLLKIAGC